MHMNRNVLRKNPEKALNRDAELMTRFWGDPSWKDAAYNTAGNLFGEPEKEDNETLAEAFRKRLKEVAGFNRVPKPIPMRNQNGATIYYLFFASQVDVAENIVLDIFNSYREFGV
jgi:three-Cys-motif partner protein